MLAIMTLLLNLLIDSVIECSYYNPPPPAPIPTLHLNRLRLEEPQGLVLCWEVSWQIQGDGGKLYTVPSKEETLAWASLSRSHYHPPQRWEWSCPGQSQKFSPPSSRAIWNQTSMGFLQQEKPWLQHNTFPPPTWSDFPLCSDKRNCGLKW